MLRVSQGERRRVLRTIQVARYTYADLIALEEAGKGQSGAKDKAQQWLRDAAVDDHWYEYTLELWTGALAQMGFSDAEIAFSGFWSQGDGASFTSNIDFPVLVGVMSNDSIVPQDSIGYDAAQKKELFVPWVFHKIGWTKYHTEPKRRHLLKFHEEGLIDGSVVRTDHHYSHYNTCTLELEMCEEQVLDGDHGGSPAYKSKYRLVREYFDGLVSDVEQLRKELCQAIYNSLEEEYEWRQSDESIMELAVGDGGCVPEFNKFGGFEGWHHDDDTTTHETINITSRLEDALAKMRHRRGRKVGKLNG